LKMLSEFEFISSTIVNSKVYNYDIGVSSIV
jgi:hypothetical protein